MATSQAPTIGFSMACMGSILVKTLMFMGFSPYVVRPAGIEPAASCSGAKWIGLSVILGESLLTPRYLASFCRRRLWRDSADLRAKYAEPRQLWEPRRVLSK
jgi:hypothetical protein